SPGHNPRASASVSQTRPGSTGSVACNASSNGSSPSGPGAGSLGGGPACMASSARSPNHEHNSSKHTFGYGLAAAVTATPTTSNDRSLTTWHSSSGWLGVMNVHRRVRSVTWSPGPTPKAWAKPASTTAPPSRTQVPTVTFGRSTDVSWSSRPIAHTPPAPPTTSPAGGSRGAGPPSVSSPAPTSGYGPLLSATPDSSASASRPATSAGPPARML